MRDVTTPRKGLEEEARLEKSRLAHSASDERGSAEPVVFPTHSPAFARIEAPRRAAAPPDVSKVASLEADLDGKKLNQVQLDERRRRLIELGSQAVSSASQRAAESADEASRTAAKLARYARRRFQERTGRVYTGTTIEDDVFPIRQPTRNELFLIVGVAFAIASAFAWRWQAMLDAKGTRVTNIPPEKPKDPNRPKLPAPVPPMPELGANPRQKESAEWLNMVLSKIWKVYQRALESWIVQSLQPAFDDLSKPAWVGRVIIQQFYLGEEPITIRSVQRRVSRRANDLQYNLAFRYTGGARMLLLVPIQSGPVKIEMPVGVRKLDLDAELWIKIRLVPMEPYVGSFTWAFANKPKIKLVLAPFRFVNLMNIPLISTFLLRLLTEDLPRNFELPNKVLIDLMKDRVSGPGPQTESPTNLAFDSGFKGELNVTLCEAENLPVWGLGFLSDPHCILTIGQQEVRSKRDSDTSIRGKAGNPVWNQDFFFLIEDTITQKLVVQVRDSPTTLKLDVAKGAIDLANLPDLEPVDVWIDLVANQGFGPTKVSRPAGRLLLRLTYKSYVDDEDEVSRPAGQLLLRLTYKSYVDDEDEGPVPMSSPTRKGKTTFVEDLPEFDVSRIPDLVTNDIPVAVAEGVQKGIDALPEEIPAAIQKGIDAIPPEIPEAVAAGSERAQDDIEVVQQNLNEAVPPSLKEGVKDFRESASDFWAEGIANAVENLGFGANTAHVEKVEPPNDVREVAIRDKSKPGVHDFAVFRDEADVSNTAEASEPALPLKVAKAGSEGSTFHVAQDGKEADVTIAGGSDVSTVQNDVSTATMTPVGASAPITDSSPVASEALERKQEGELARGVNRTGRAPPPRKEDGSAPRRPSVANVSVREPTPVADVSIADPLEDQAAEKNVMGDPDAVDLGETVEDVKKQLTGALKTLKEEDNRRVLVWLAILIPLAYLLLLSINTDNIANP
ncbi:hypothetical protein KFL_006270050 [Klebsormidium nitens]|uniref:Uncharacterized protein n=1 Tax=Klebsormidium nitens TaxID=105231 RepID=A0A1Y1IHZ3_KLENI|nr:hypothetical protein KFL_006270050 [Klebsormidium nitens]|eukprot:GAQ90323.1 hypothetical protein KFL_006270050 [Klebsormidium nitens]